ncbi:hypothetical protein [Pseudomonas sp. COR18]|uniref:hypothetical protein n=1 Tax=Pseudomonas sp. COR18 TaxID=3399680 RepID=UPI003AFFF9FF
MLDGGAGADVLNGGAGTDTASYANSTAGVTVNLVTGTGVGGDAQGDTLMGIESVVGSAFNDTLTAQTSGHSLVGARGTTPTSSTARACRWSKRLAKVTMKSEPQSTA